MRPTLNPAAVDPTLHGAIATILFHQKILLRLKNRLRSSFLRLPKEILIHILSYIMDHEGHSIAWKPIYLTCYHIHTVMRAATELWWEVDCSRAREANFVFWHAKGNPQVLLAELSTWNHEARRILDFWRYKRLLQGHRLRRLELLGYPSDLYHFQWIFEVVLPRLYHLKIHFFPQPPMTYIGNLQIPIVLQLPMNMPLRILDLRNTTLPWSSQLFVGLCELRLDFQDCEPMEISEDEFLRVLKASPQLESLSLIQAGPDIDIDGHARQPTPERILQFPKLTFIELENSPAVVGFILAHISVPAVTSLIIYSPTSSRNLAQSLAHLTPNDDIQNRLFSNPPVFRVLAFEEDSSELMIFNIGSFEISFDAADFDEMAEIRDHIMTHIQRLVPPSVTSLKLDFIDMEFFDGLWWEEFLGSHSELQTIEFLDGSSSIEADTFFSALSYGTDNAPYCPKLEFIRTVGDPIMTISALLDYLRDRKNAGLELKRLKWESLTANQSEMVKRAFGPLVGILEVDVEDDMPGREVCPVSMTCDDCFSIERLSDFPGK